MMTSSTAAALEAQGKLQLRAELNEVLLLHGIPRSSLLTVLANGLNERFSGTHAGGNGAPSKPHTRASYSGDETQPGGPAATACMMLFHASPVDERKSVSIDDPNVRKFAWSSSSPSKRTV